MSWVPFHSSLREGDKRGFPRAIRFIYLELSLLARPTAGTIALPRGFKTDVDALHDILGGDRREIRVALELLTVPLDPSDPSDRPLISLSGTENRRVITVTSHDRWVRPDTTVDRVRRFRKRKSERYPGDTDLCNADGNVTGNGNVTVQRRGEERKEEESRGKAAAADAAPDPARSPEIPEPEKPTKRRKRARLPQTFLPVDWQPDPEDAADVRAQGLDLEAVVIDFRGHWRGKGEAGADWSARFRQNTARIARTDWLRERFVAVASAPPSRQPAPDPGPPGTPPTGVLEDMFAAIAGEKPKSALELFGPDPGSEIRFRRDVPVPPETKTSGEMK